MSACLFAAAPLFGKLLQSMEVEFHPQLNWFLGSNAQGKTKTSLRLFIVYRPPGSLFARLVDDEMIQFEQEAAAIESVLQREEGQEQDSSGDETKQTQASLLVNAKKAKEALFPFVGRPPAVVVFRRDDLFLVKGGPSLRRRYTDTMMFQMDAGYLAHLQQYERTLKQRNSLLRQRVENLENQLAIWDLPLAELLRRGDYAKAV